MVRVIDDSPLPLGEGQGVRAAKGLVMTPMIQDSIVLLLVAAAAVYMVVRLRRLAAGQSKCACGSKSCGKVSPPNGGLPVLPPSCNQDGCGCEKS